MQQAGDYSLLQALGDFFDTLPVNIVNGGQLGLLKNAASLFPPLLRLGLECRLNGHQQVDLQLCMRRDEDDLQAILNWMKAEFLTGGDEQASIIAFFKQWADCSSINHQYITETFLELDVLPSGNRTPLLFLALEPKLFAAELKTPCLTILKDTLGESRSFYNLFEAVIDACPQDAFVAYIGLLFSRDIDVLRVNIKKLPVAAVVPFLQSIGYQWINAELENWILFVYNYCDRVTLCIDIGKEVYPKIGFECFWDDQPAIETYWGFFLTELQKQNLVKQDKADAILQWDKDFIPGQVAAWPAHLWVQSLLKPDNEFTILRKKLSHLKLAYCPGKPVEIKAYLGYGNIWHAINTNGNAYGKPSLEKQSIEVNTINVDGAVSKGIDFLLNSQQQSGWWKDFYLPAGKSDEWVTAYLGFNLATLKSDKTMEALNRARAMLKTRYRDGKGWGYNALTPADADSTIWACLFIGALGMGGQPPLPDLMEQYFNGTDGIVTYSEKDPIRAKTGLSADKSFEGWQMPHLCVTAAYALTGDARALDYLYKHQNTNGHWDSYWWVAPEYATALAVEAMYKNDREKYSEAIFKAVTWACGQTEIAFSNAGTNVFKMALLLKILLYANNDLKYESLKTRIVSFLLNAQQGQGSWGPSAELSVPMPGNTNPQHIKDNRVVTDRNKNFTTVTVLAALDKYLDS